MPVYSVELDSSKFTTEQMVTSFIQVVSKFVVETASSEHEPKPKTRIVHILLSMITDALDGNQKSFLIDVSENF